jgi:hypothetical protein
LDVFKKCNIKSFPINCYDILKQYDIEVYPYSSLSDNLREYCIKFSNDALKYRDKVCYNDDLPPGRIRFSLMHELGHIVLNHSNNHTPQMEQEANCFASNILAPRMTIHYAKCKNETDVSKLFGIQSSIDHHYKNENKLIYQNHSFYGIRSTGTIFYKR